MAQPWRNGGASLPQEELLTMNESTRQIAAAYRRMAAEARYRPAAPSDGLGGITVPVEQLDLDAEAIRYARNWWAEEDERRFWIGCCHWPTRPATIFAIEAARLLCAGDGHGDHAHQLLRMAAAELDMMDDEEAA
jgi:hypothetical protein